MRTLLLLRARRRRSLSRRPLASTVCRPSRTREDADPPSKAAHQHAVCNQPQADPAQPFALPRVRGIAATGNLRPTPSNDDHVPLPAQHQVVADPAVTATDLTGSPYPRLAPVRLGGSAPIRRGPAWELAECRYSKPALFPDHQRSLVRATAPSRLEARRHKTRLQQPARRDGQLRTPADVGSCLPEISGPSRLHHARAPPPHRSRPDARYRH